MIQHLVSRVLLRRWASDKNGLICGLDLNTLTERVGLVDSFGAIKDLVTKDADEIERLWNNEVERKLTHPLDLLEQGLILDPKNTVHLECLKDCLSLHWARSYTLVHMLKGSQGRFVDQVAKGVLRKYTPAQAVKALTGFYVPGPSAYFVFRQKIDEDLLDQKGIDGDERQVRRQSEIDAAILERRLQTAERGADHAFYRLPLFVHFDCARRDTGHVEQIADEMVQPLRLFVNRLGKVAPSRLREPRLGFEQGASRTGNDRQGCTKVVRDRAQESAAELLGLHLQVCPLGVLR